MKGGRRQKYESLKKIEIIRKGGRRESVKTENSEENQNAVTLEEKRVNKKMMKKRV